MAADDKKTSSYGAYPDDVAFLNTLKAEGETGPDVLAMVVEDYRRHQTQTHGERVAEEAVAFINARAAELCELVEGAARAAADELAIAKGNFEKIRSELSEQLEEERSARAREASGLRSELAAAREASKRLGAVAAERDELVSRLALAEEEGRKSRDAAEEARIAENAAKASNVDLQEELRVALKARLQAESDRNALATKVANLENSSKLAEAQQWARVEKAEVQLKAAKSEAEQAKGNVSFLSAQADDLRRQLDEARRDNEGLRRALERLQGSGK